MSTDILTVVADVYRTRGPLQQQVPARAFLSLMGQDQVEAQLARLLDAGSLLVGSQGTVMLSGTVRASVLTANVLSAWLREADAEAPHVRELLRTGVRTELRELVRHCLASPDHAGLHRRGVELAAVLATSELDVRAVDATAGFSGPPWRQLHDLMTIPEGACASIEELQTRMRRIVSARILADTKA